MTSILLTGSTGNLGRSVVPKLLEKKYEVYALLRDVSKCPEGCVPLKGDVTQEGLGLKDFPVFDEVWNLSGIVNLRGNKESFEVNVAGARKVAEFAVKQKVKRLVHTSTAYSNVHSRNPYEQSKWLGEEHIREVARGLAVTIFKPSIIVGDSPPAGAFYQFVRLICSTHRRAEIVRRWVEGTLRLPVLEPVLRVKGNPDGLLNLVHVDAVTDAMVDIKEEGEFYLTNPTPPTLRELGEWVGEIMLLNIRFEQGFKATPIEAVFQRLVAPFSPYLLGDSFKSDLRECPAIDRGFVQKSTSKYLLG